MVLPSDFDIRYSSMEDLPILQKWMQDSAEREAFPFESDLETEEALKNWIGFSKYKASLTGIIDQAPCAIGTLFLMPYRKVAHHCSFYLIVDPFQRRKGIGTSMVRNLMHLAKTRFHLESIHAEVYEPNPILKILEKERFQIFARQENFVKIGGRMCGRVLAEHFFYEP